MMTEKDIAATRTALRPLPSALPASGPTGKGTWVGRMLARMLTDCFPVWADTPPYERPHAQHCERRRQHRTALYQAQTAAA